MIIPTGYAQVNLFFTGEAAPRGAQVTFGVDNTAMDLDALAVATAAADAWSATGLTLQVDSITFAQAKAKLGPNATGPEAVFVVSGDGTRAQPPCTPQVCVLGMKNTDLGGRKSRGRMFIPGVAEEDVDGSGVVSSAAVGSWNSTLTDLLANLSTNSIPMVLLHSDATTPTPVTSMVLNTLAVTQRRRIRKVGGRRRTP